MRCVRGLVQTGKNQVGSLPDEGHVVALMRLAWQVKLQLPHEVWGLVAWLSTKEAAAGPSVAVPGLQPAAVQLPAAAGLSHHKILNCLRMPTADAM